MNHAVNGTNKTAAQVWLGHPKRRTYDGGVVFDPSGKNVRPNQLNIWRGFARKPKQGCWAKMEWHLRNIICNGDEGSYTYLFNWNARMVQLPGEQGETIIVLRSLEGSGKGFLGHAMREIFGGAHGRRIGDEQKLVGRFNAHMAGVVFLFADEAFYAGDKAGEGILKGLATEPTFMMEGKGRDAIEMANFLHILMASNKDHVVPVSIGGRRIVFFEVSEAMIGNHDYFAALHKELYEEGGLEAMLYDMLNADISGWNHRAIPNSVGLMEQKKRSLPPEHKWWMENLHRGYVYETRFGLHDDFSYWHDQMTMELITKSYEAWMRKHGMRPGMRVVLGKFLSKMGPTTQVGAKRLPADTPIGEDMVEVELPGGPTRREPKPIYKTGTTDNRPFGYALGTLEAARKRFEEVTGVDVNWDGEESESDIATEIDKNGQTKLRLIG
jgi:hypothetical protein